MKKIIILLAAASAFCLSSCSESLLDIPQQGVRSEANSYITDEDCESAIAAAYARVKTIYAGTFSLYAWKGAGDGTGRQQIDPYETNGLWFKELIGDDQFPGSFEDELGDYASCELKPTNAWMSNYYMLLFQCVYLSNLVINNFDAASSEIKARDIAEAKVLRAFCYYELVSLWGPVPKVEKPLASAEELQVPASSEEDIWAFIEKDLTEALDCPYLTSKTSLADSDGAARITTQTASMILAKAYLWQKKYAEAKDLLVPIIESGVYALIDEIGDLYHQQANGCTEYVWEFVRKDDPNNRTFQYGWTGIDVNWYFACGMSQGPEARNYYDFNSGYGWGFFWPTKELYDTFVAEEGVDGYRLSRSVLTFEQVQAMNIYYDYDLDWDNEGYFRFKWLPTLADEPATLNSYYGVSCNTPVFRYADMLLLAAEACVNSGAADKAKDYVNQVRKRAHLAQKSSVTMEDVKLERRLELCMEGHRFQDLKRWGDLPTAYKNRGDKFPKFKIVRSASNDYSTAEGIYNAVYNTSLTYVENTRSGKGWQDKDYYLPYPTTEILTNHALTQHSGY